MFVTPLLLDSDSTMFIYCNLAVLMLVLNFNGQVHAGTIIDGHEAKPHSRPYMVLVEMIYKDIKEHCGGFLLSEDFVMTAAHCQAESYNVLLGFHNYFDKNKLNISVKQAFPHKDYNENEYTNDIMLLKLSSKVNFSDNVIPIALADHNPGSLPKSCSVAGWGKTSVNSKFMSFKLMEANVTLVDNEECAEEHAFCSEGKNGPGQGDSGGPLVCEDGTAYGVVTANKVLPSNTTLYKYTKIADNQDWIDMLMKLF